MTELPILPQSQSVVQILSSSRYPAVSRRVVEQAFKTSVKNVGKTPDGGDAYGLPNGIVVALGEAGPNRYRLEARQIGVPKFDPEFLVESTAKIVNRMSKAEFLDVGLNYDVIIMDAANQASDLMMRLFSARNSRQLLGEKLSEAKSFNIGRAYEAGHLNLTVSKVELAMGDGMTGYALSFNFDIPDSSLVQLNRRSAKQFNKMAELCTEIAKRLASV